MPSEATEDNLPSDRHTAERELLALNQRMLESIASGDWKTYAELCDPTLSAFEPEARGHLIEGMPFHQFYFDLESARTPVNTTMATPHIRWLGDSVTVISYVRLTQRLGSGGVPETARCEETRVWQRQQGKWQHVHFHRSTNS